MSIILNFCKISGLRHGALHIGRRAMCSAAKEVPLEYEKDPQPLFTDPETQNLLRSITQMQISKIFRSRAVEDNSSEIQFMTTEQLEEEFLKTVTKAKQLLQMPPVIKVREDQPRVISKDPALKDFSDTKYVITDITYGLNQSHRKVVVRQTDGSLEYAPQEIAKRMKQIYAPLEGRKLRTPRMFQGEHLQRCLDEHKYEFILDRLALQYEPFERDFQRISALVYQHLNESQEFDTLRSTRHFGPMAFFYAWHRSIDDLLSDMIRRDFLRNGVELIALFYKVHAIPVEYAGTLERLAALQRVEEPALEELRSTLKTAKTGGIQEEIQTAIGKTHEDFEADEICIGFIEEYIRTHGKKKVQLELALQTLKETLAEKKRLFEGLNRAHGLQE